jgi:hypothetical protein
MYTTEDKIEKYMMIDIDSSMSSQLTQWITAAQLYIDKYTGKVGGFDASVASAKYYDGNGKSEIDIDEFISLSSVQLLELDSDDVEWTLVEGKTEDFITYPYNTTPKYRLTLMPGSQIGAFYEGKKRIKVTGIWGNSTVVPADIELAATMLVAEVIEKGLKGGKISSETLGDYTVSFDNVNVSIDVKRILDRYKIYIL